MESYIFNRCARCHEEFGNNHKNVLMNNPRYVEGTATSEGCVLHNDGQIALCDDCFKDFCKDFLLIPDV